MNIDKFLFGLGAGSQLLLLLVLQRRKLRRIFPVLFGYMIYLVISDPAFYICSRLLTNARYETVYVLSSIPDYILQAGIIMEVVWAVTMPLKDYEPRILQMIAGSLAFSGIIIATAVVSWGHIVVVNTFGRMFLHWSMGFALFRVAALVGALVSMRVLGVGWQRQAARIAVGISIYAVVQLLVQVAHELSGPGATDTPAFANWERIGVVGWIAALVYLTFYLYAEDTPAAYDSAAART